MRAVILAAGRGTRLRPYTTTQPKCLLPFAGQLLLERQLQTLRACGIHDVVIVAGYRADQIVAPGARVRLNACYEETDVVGSLMSVAEDLEGDVVVCYGDIIYERRILEVLLQAPHHDLSVLMDEDWRMYYDARFGSGQHARPGQVVSTNGCLLSTQRPAVAPGEIEAQYIGLVRFGPEGCRLFRQLTRRIDQEHGPRSWRRGRAVRQAAMKDVLDLLIERRMPVHAPTVKRGWLEFDSVDDYHKAQRWHQEGSLHRFIQL